CPFPPAVPHPILFTPTLLAEVRRVGWAQALEGFRERCLERSPRPQADLSGEVVAIQPTAAQYELTFPLVPRRRLIGLAFGTVRSARRGRGSDVVSSRPYQVGDDVDAIDWNASAKISAGHATDEVGGRGGG